jgi:L-alanine-DL-glutamate epimerase-like enolase superfamily enzyme
MAVAASNTLIFELKPIPSPMQHELVTDPIDMIDGWVAPPDKPGLGVTVDEGVVARYRFTEADLGA